STNTFLFVQNLQIGIGNAGTLNLYAGSITTIISNFTLAKSVVATGTVWIAGGTVNNSQFTTIIGELGRATMTISNGTLLTRSLILGAVNNTNAAGTFNVNGGTTTISSNMLVGIDVFPSSTVN